jgi:hypothetical protein
MMNNSLDQAAVLSATQILAAEHVSVAESIQMLLMYIVSHEDTDMYRAGVSFIKEILRLVCEATEPEMAVL